MCDRANVDYKNFYSLRHSHATLLLEMNVHPKIVQERLGHSDIKITLETYSHVTSNDTAKSRRSYGDYTIIKRGISPLFFMPG